jgi:hypothetical protein
MTVIKCFFCNFRFDSNNVRIIKREVHLTKDWEKLIILCPSCQKPYEIQFLRQINDDVSLIDDKQQLESLTKNKNEKNETYKSLKPDLGCTFCWDKHGNISNSECYCSCHSSKLQSSTFA